jgi:hypothetical protein
MPTTSRIFWPFAVVCLLSALALAQTPAADQIVANQNRVPAEVIIYLTRPLF